MDALLKSGFKVIAYDPSFYNKAVREKFSEQYPGAIASHLQDPEELVQDIWTRYGHVDVIVSNDVYPAIHAPIEDLEISDLSTTLENLLIFPFRLIKAASVYLKSRGQGNIIMVTSCRMELPMSGGTIPDMARAAANAFVKSLSIEMAPYGVPVNAIAPNFLYSEAYFPRTNYIDDPKGKAYIENTVPAGRLGDPEEVGELIGYLATMKGTFHTGSIIKFSGGWPAAPKSP